MSIISTTPKLSFETSTKLNTSGTSLEIEAKSDLKNNHISSILTILNSTIGVTILYMPKFFIVSGIFFGTLQLLFFSILTFLTNSILSQAGDILKLRTFFQIGEKVFRKKKSVIFSFFYILILLGNIIVFQIYVIDSLSSLISTFWLENRSFEYLHNLYLTFLVVFLTNFFLFPILLSENLEKVRFLSTVCSFSLFFGISIIILSFCFPNFFGIQIMEINYDKVSYFKFEGIFISLGFYMLAFCQQLLAVEINDDLYPKNKKTAKNIFLITSILTFLIYFTISIFGYFALYQENIETLENYILFLIIEKKSDSKFLFISNFLIITGILLGNVFNYYPLINYLNFKINKKNNQVPKKILLELKIDPEDSFDYELDDFEIEQNYLKKRFYIVLSLFFFVLVILLVFFYFEIKEDMVFNFISAICVPVISFVFPGFIFLRLLRYNFIEVITIWDYFYSYFIIFLGFGLWVFSIFVLFKIK